MHKFPVDAPKSRVVRALERLGFRIVREKAHISMVRDNQDGTTTPLTMPNHPTLKASTGPCAPRPAWVAMSSSPPTKMREQPCCPARGRFGVPKHSAWEPPGRPIGLRRARDRRPRPRVDGERSG